MRNSPTLYRVETIERDLLMIAPLKTIARYLVLRLEGQARIVQETSDVEQTCEVYCSRGIEAGKTFLVTRFEMETV